MIKNIIFDWSGTLSNDILLVYEAVMIVFGRFGKKRISFDEFRREFELPYMEFYKKYKIRVSKEEIDELYHKAIHSMENPKPFPEAKD